jgi:hypothetical protein
MPWKKDVGDGGSVVQKHAHGSLPDVVRDTKKSSTPVASVTTAEKGSADQAVCETTRFLTSHPTN